MRAPDRPLSVREAYDALDDFGRRGGRLRLLLLLHASVPQSFRADLLNLLKVNFLGTEAGTDLTVDADVLLSEVVQPAAAGYYRLDPEVRRHALALLDATYREQAERRSVQVARFVLAYADALERQASLSLDAMLAEYLALQRWVALAFIDPGAAAEAFARAIERGIDETSAAARLRLGGVTAALMIPLSGHQDLLAYARGVNALGAGDLSVAERLLQWNGDDELQVGDVTLRPGRTLLSVAPTSQGENASTKRVATPLLIGVPAPTRLIGRENELAQLRRLLASPQVRERMIANRNPAALSHASVVSLTGPSGIGKWTVASRIAADNAVVRHFSDGVIWLDEPPSGLRSAALNAYAEAVGATVLFGAGETINADGFRDVFARRRVLFIIDEDSAPSLMPVLYSSGPQCVVLRLLSRSPTDPTFAVVLAPFGTADANALLALHGVAEGQAPEMIAFAEGNPLLLRLLASLRDDFDTAPVIGRLQQLQRSSGEVGVAARVQAVVRMLSKSFSLQTRRETAELVDLFGTRTIVAREELRAFPSTVDTLQRTGMLTLSGSTARLHRLVKDALMSLGRDEAETVARAFTCDVFISYAHLDNIELVDGRAGWVANFVRALKIRIAQLLGRQVTVDWDPKLAGNDLLSEATLGRPRGAAVFVSIVSPRSVRSEWVRSEMDAFVEAAEEHGQLTVGDKSRLFKVLKTPVPIESQPHALQSLLGYEFFRIDPESGRVRESEEVFGPEAERDFWIKLDDLAHDIVDTLEKLEQPRSDSPGNIWPQA